MLFSYINTTKARFLPLEQSMKKSLLFVALLFCLLGSAQTVTVSGYWYGNANVKLNSSANNYLIELILKQDKTLVTGVMNYYFKNTFRSIKVSGNYNSMTRQVILRNVPLTYHGSAANMEIDCIMDFMGTLRVAKAGSSLIGTFGNKKPEYKYTCVDVDFNLKMNADASKTDSILQAIREYKEENQVWKPSYTDTLVAANVIPRKVVNYVVDNEFRKRENVIANEIETDADSLSIDFYDNGEVDGDSISIFYNNDLIAFNRILSTQSVHFDIGLDSTREFNEIGMFADNLGSIPPNTALMVVSDGKKRYEIRMSSSLEKNAILRIRRKKPTAK